MENYPSNSHRAKEGGKSEKAEKPEPKKVEKVVTGEVTRRKKPLGKRFSETFIGGDSGSVWGYVVFEVVIPKTKDMVSDAISEGVEKMLFGEVRGRSRGRNRSGSDTRTSYGSMYRGGGSNLMREDPRQAISRRARNQFDFDEIILPTRVEAVAVIDSLFDIVSQYEMVTVADLYELVGISANFTEEKYGWTDLRGAGITSVKGGYLLDLPKPEPLD